MNVLFISSTRRVDNPYLDPSVRYRCYGPAEDLRQGGHGADVCAMATFSPDYARNYDKFVFHRPLASDALTAALRAIHLQGKPAVADIDDLLFDTLDLESSPQLRNGLASLAAVRRTHLAYRAGLAAFDTVSVSTTALATRISDVFPRASVHVFPNKLSDTWAQVGRRMSARAWGSSVIGYFSGTRSHDRDLVTWAPALATVLGRHPESRLALVGPVAVPDALSAPRYRRQLLQVPAVAYDQLPALIRACAVTVAPLEDTAFNACKSAIKYLESAVFGIPVVASPLTDMRRFGDSTPLLAFAATHEAIVAALSAALLPSRVRGAPEPYPGQRDVPQMADWLLAEGV